MVLRRGKSCHAKFVVSLYGAVRALMNQVTMTVTNIPCNLSLTRLMFHITNLWLIKCRLMNLYVDYETTWILYICPSS